MKPTDTHLAFRAGLLELLQKHGAEMSSAEMLALAAHAVGQLIAHQDQRTMTSDRAMKIVSDNIEQGNLEVFENLNATKGSA